MPIQYSIEWDKIINTPGSAGPESDFAYDVDQSKGTTTYVIGRNSDGDNGSGDVEGFISKISPSGAEEWRKSKSSIYDDGFNTVETNADKTAIYVGGQIYIQPGQTEPGSVYGQTYLGGGSDGFITKYDNLGNEAWTRLFGGSGFDSINSLTVDINGDIVATGSINSTGANVDAATIKIDADGNTLWTKVLSSTTSIQYGNVIQTDSSGSVYVAGNTEGDLDGQSFLGGGTDIFVTKYSQDGTKQWTKIHGTDGDDFVGGIAIGNDGSIYLSGTTNRDLYGESNNGTSNEDAFLLKLSTSGTVDWARMVGTASNDYGRDIIAADDGYIYFSGYTFGNLGGNSNKGGSDIFLTRFSSAGSQGSIFLLGSEGFEEAQGLKVDQNGGIYVVGATWGNPFNGVTTNASALRSDAFITKLSLTSITSPGSGGGSGSGGSGGTSDPVTIPEESISNPPASTPQLPSGNDVKSVGGDSGSFAESPVLGIQPQEIVTTVELTTPLTLGNLQVTKAVVGTPQKDLITGSDEGEVLAGGEGKDRMTGGRGPDAFLFETPGEFGKQKRDTITDFNPDEGDKVAISSDAFDGINKIKFKAVNGKDDLNDAASTKKILIYNEKNGKLYFNENGKRDGFGDGGEFAKLLGTPDLGKEDFVLI